MKFNHKLSSQDSFVRKSSESSKLCGSQSCVKKLKNSSSTFTEHLTNRRLRNENVTSDSDCAKENDQNHSDDVFDVMKTDKIACQQYKTRSSLTELEDEQLNRTSSESEELELDDYKTSLRKRKSSDELSFSYSGESDSNSKKVKEIQVVLPDFYKKNKHNQTPKSTTLKA